MLYFRCEVHTGFRTLRHRLHLQSSFARLSGLLLALLISVPVLSQDVTMEDGKVSLLKSMLVNTTWPQEESIDTLEIGLYGRDRNLMRVIRRDFPGFRVRGKPVSTRYYSSLEEARSAQVLIISPSENAEL